VSAINVVSDSVRAAAPWLRQVGANAQATLATLFRPPRRALVWPSAGLLTLFVACAAIAVLAVMVQTDDWSLAHVRKLPGGLIEAFDRFTDLGKSGFFLWPIGLVLIALALLEAELNINYLYSFIPQPQGKPVLGLSMEDNETAEQALRRHQFRTLKQGDISR